MLFRSQDMSLDELSSAGGSWDQFATNQKLFGVQSTYDEDIYTTPLDRSSPFYRQHLHKAQKIAVEIQRVGTRKKKIAHTKYYRFRKPQRIHTWRKSVVMRRSLEMKMKKTGIAICAVVGVTHRIYFYQILLCYKRCSRQRRRW